MCIVLSYGVVLSPGAHSMTNGINLKAISLLRSADFILPMPHFWETNVVEDKLCITSKAPEGSKTACRNITGRGFNWLGSVPWCSPYLCDRARLGMLSLVSWPATRQMVLGADLPWDVGELPQVG